MFWAKKTNSQMLRDQTCIVVIFILSLCSSKPSSPVRYFSVLTGDSISSPKQMHTAMAACSRISKTILRNHLSRSTTGYLSSSSFGLPSALISRRGIASKLYVAGLSFYTTEKALLDAFSRYGQVIEATVMMDKVSHRSKGFGFVTYASEDEAEKAITEMDGKALHGRVICVELAKPRRPTSIGVPMARGPPEPPTEQQ